MVDIEQLRTELAKPAYTGLSDAAALNALLGITTPGYVAFSPADAMMALVITTTVDWGWLNGVADGWITSAQANPGAAAVTVTPLTRRIAVSIRDLFRLPLPVAVTSGDKATLIHNGLTALVNANVITLAGQTAVEALASTNVQTFAGVTQHDIWVARGQQ